MKPGTGWIAGVVTTLALTVGANIWLMTVAGDDPSVAVEPDYYQKAVAFDSTLAQGRRNATLGWRVTPSLARITDGRATELRVRLADATGASIADATVTVEAMANARSDVRLTATFTAEGDGYVATLPIARPGLWEFRFSVTRGAQHFTASERLDAVASPSGTHGP
jgi:nitrogen fixation protein FixH